MKILGIESPKCCAVRERAGRNRQIELPPSRPAKCPIQIASDGGLLWPEWDGHCRREHRLLGLDLLAQPRPPKPLVEDQRTQKDAFPVVNPISELGCGVLWPGQGIDEDRRVEVNHRAAV